jgi:hypothetical protein
MVWPRYQLAVKPPTIADPSYLLLEVNSTTGCSNSWSLLRVDFDHTDPNGDVQDGSTVVVDYSFSGGNSGTFVLAGQTINITGDGFSGVVNNLVCFGYGNTLSVPRDASSP